MFGKDFLSHGEGRVSFGKEQNSWAGGVVVHSGGHRGVGAQGGQARLSAGL